MDCLESGCLVGEPARICWPLLSSSLPVCSVVSAVSPSLLLRSLPSLPPPASLFPLLSSPVPLVSCSSPPAEPSSLPPCPPMAASSLFPSLFSPSLPSPSAVPFLLSKPLPLPPFCPCWSSATPSVRSDGRSGPLLCPSCCGWERGCTSRLFVLCRWLNWNC